VCISFHKTLSHILHSCWYSVGVWVEGCFSEEFIGAICNKWRLKMASVYSSETILRHRSESHICYSGESTKLAEAVTRLCLAGTMTSSVPNGKCQVMLYRCPSISLHLIDPTVRCCTEQLTASLNQYLGEVSRNKWLRTICKDKQKLWSRKGWMRD
jgi:hypothetical protein